MRQDPAPRRPRSLSVELKPFYSNTMLSQGTHRRCIPEEGSPAVTPQTPTEKSSPIANSPRASRARRKCEFYATESPTKPVAKTPSSGGQCVRFRSLSPWRRRRHLDTAPMDESHDALALLLLSLQMSPRQRLKDRSASWPGGRSSPA
ncbi:unnamed protein product, partial [Meganyctiphanes norvegica]